MDTAENRRAAALNVRLYPLVKIVTKRVYLPLTAIYFVNVVGLSLPELGLAIALAAGATLIFEVPTGYFSDRFSRRYSFVLAGLFAILANLLFVFMQNKTGVYIGVILEALAYAFISGTGQAIIHDSLTVLKRPEDYSKVMSRAQALGLTANALLIALVPLTFAIDPRLPFLFGIVQFSCLAILGLKLQDVTHYEDNDIAISINFNWVRKNPGFMLFAFVFGIFAATYTSPSHFQSLAMEAYGLNPAILGIFFSIASLTGAVVGIFIHKLKQLGVKKYSVFDACINIFTFSLFTFGNAWLAVAGLIVSMAFWRYRDIIYNDYILQTYNTRYKATLMSIIYNMIGLNEVWQTIVIGLLVSAYGLQNGFTIMTVAVACLAIPFVIVTNRTLHPKKLSSGGSTPEMYK